MEDPLLRKIYLSLLALYCVLSLYGSAWISDEFDALRLATSVYLGVPLIISLVTMRFMDREFYRRWPYLFNCLVAGILLCFAWGNLMLLNALEQKKDVLVSESMSTMTATLSADKGVFGWVYQKRW